MSYFDNKYNLGSVYISFLEILRFIKYLFKYSSNIWRNTLNYSSKMIIVRIVQCNADYNKIERLAWFRGVRNGYKLFILKGNKVVVKCLVQMYFVKNLIIRTAWAVKVQNELLMSIT